MLKQTAKGKSRDCSARHIKKLSSWLPHRKDLKDTLREVLRKELKHVSVPQDVKDDEKQDLAEVVIGTHVDKKHGHF